MTTTFPYNGEPVLIGGRDVRLRFWGMPRNPGDPKRVEGTFTVTGTEGDLVLDAFIGPKGDPGEPLAPWRIEWDSTITNSADLPDVETLNETDDGRAWVIGTTLWVYVHAIGPHGEYRTIDAGIQGPVGLTPQISAEAELVVTSDPDALTIGVVPSGTSTNPHFKFNVPTAPLIGPPGPSTAIRLAPDYDNTMPPLDGQGVIWDEAAERFKPGDLSPMAVKMYTIPHANFVDYEGSATRQLVASLDVEPQPNAYYPDIAGHVKWLRSAGLFSSVQVEVEVRIGDTGVGTGENAPLCGLAPYDPSWALIDTSNIAHILPHFSDTGDPTRAIAPDSAAGRVPAGQAKTFYVFLHKTGGSGNYQFFADPSAQLRINLNPVS